MLWVKSFHIVFVASWFAGLFYLPRIFVNLAMVPSGPEGQAERDRLLLMSRKLYRFMMPLMIGTLFFGFWLCQHIFASFGTRTKKNIHGGITTIIKN